MVRFAALDMCPGFQAGVATHKHPVFGGDYWWVEWPDGKSGYYPKWALYFWRTAFA